MSKPEEAALPQRPWAILASIPVIMDAAAAHLMQGEELTVDINAPPGVSVLILTRGFIPEIKPHIRYPYITAADPSGRLLLCASHRSDRWPFNSWRSNIDYRDIHNKDKELNAYFLCDATTFTAAKLPDRIERDGHILHSGNVGLIRRDDGRFMVAELQPEARTDNATLLYHWVGTQGWVRKKVPYFRDHPEWGNNGVITHAGKLWWVDLSYGLLTCDPFVKKPDLRYVPLPEGCVVPRNSGDRYAFGVLLELDKRRCLKVSGGKLRYVQIDDAWKVTRMWTLHDTEGTDWRPQYVVPFTEIWEHESYRKTGLRCEVPVLALVHPWDPEVLYFWQDDWIFAVRSSTREVLSCECFDPATAGLPVREFPSSRLVHAWELPLTLRPDHDAMSKRPRKPRLSLPRSPSRTPAMSKSEGEAPPEAEDPWAILASVPDVTLPASGKALSVVVNKPPGISVLKVARGFVPGIKDCFPPRRYPYIAATEPSGRILLCTSHICHWWPHFDLEGVSPRSLELDSKLNPYFLCDTASFTVFKLPRRDDRDGPILHFGTVGIIRRDGCQFMVAELQPKTGTDSATLLCHWVGTNGWVRKNLRYSPEHPEWRNNGTISHGGKLWWVDLSYGLLTCDPIAEQPNLRYVPLPPGCVVSAAFRKESPDYLLTLADRRCVKVSDGKLRYVETDNTSGIRMWTLDDPEGTEWMLQHEAPLVEIWEAASYRKTEELRREVPVPAIVHPWNPDVVYFWQEKWIFAVDVPARKVLSCEDFELATGLPWRREPLYYSVHAWEMPPMLLLDHVSNLLIREKILQSSAGNTRLEEEEENHH